MALLKISIIIPHFNGKKILKDCLNSLSRVKYPNYNVIIVDNASTDESVQFVENTFSQVKIIKNLSVT